MESIESFKLLLMACKNDIESAEIKEDDANLKDEINSIFDDGFLKQ